MKTIAGSIPRARSRASRPKPPLDKDTAELDRLRPILWQLAETVARRMKKAGIVGKSVTLKLKTADFRLVTRSRRLKSATQSAEEMFQVAEPLLVREADGRDFRLIGIGAHDLVEAGQVAQGDLFGGFGPAESKVDKALDAVREKFGDDAIIKAEALGQSSSGRDPRRWSELDGLQRAMEALQWLGLSVGPEVRARLRPLLVFVPCETLLPLKMVAQYRFATPKPLKTCRAPWLSIPGSGSSTCSRTGRLSMVCSICPGNQGRYSGSFSACRQNHEPAGGRTMNMNVYRVPVAGVKRHSSAISTPASRSNSSCSPSMRTAPFSKLLGEALDLLFQARGKPLMWLLRVFRPVSSHHSVPVIGREGGWLGASRLTRQPTVIPRVPKRVGSTGS